MYILLIYNTAMEQLVFYIAVHICPDSVAKTCNSIAFSSDALGNNQKQTTFVKEKKKENRKENP